MNETARQPEGQWCWCDDPPENQPPHDCAEDHATRGACQYDGAHVHPSREWAQRARKAQEAVNALGAGPPASRLADDDQELIARARRAGAELRRRPGDLDRLAGALLAELADRLDGQAAVPAPLQPHGYDPDSHIPGNSCTYCGRGQDDPLHGRSRR